MSARREALDRLFLTPTEFRGLHQRFTRDMQTLRRHLAEGPPRGESKSEFLERILRGFEREEWQAFLRKHAPIPRQMVRKLVEGRIVFTPDPEAGRYRFTMPGTLGNFFSGIVPLAMASPTGIAPFMRGRVERRAA